MASKIAMLSTQMEADRRGVGAVLEEIRALRQSVEGMRADFLQRLTRVETRLDQGK
jgi:hypothetical protein